MVWENGRRPSRVFPLCEQQWYRRSGEGMAYPSSPEIAYVCNTKQLTKTTDGLIGVQITQKSNEGAQNHYVFPQTPAGTGAEKTIEKGAFHRVRAEVPFRRVAARKKSDPQVPGVCTDL